MIFPLARRFDQFLNYMGWRRLIGVPHTEIDDILTTLPGLQLEGLHLRENIRRKPFDSIKPVA